MSSVISRNSAGTKQDYRSEISTRLSSTYPESQIEGHVSESGATTRVHAFIAARSAFLHCPERAAQAMHQKVEANHLVSQEDSSPYSLSSML